MAEGENLTKSDLIGIIQKETALSSRSKAEDTLNALLGSIAECMEKGEDVNLSDFGSFKKLKTNERQGRNPQTGEQITIPAGFRIKFKPAKKLLEKLNQPEDLPEDD